MTKLLISSGLVNGAGIHGSTIFPVGTSYMIPIYFLDRPLDKGNAASGNESLPRRAHA